MLALLAKGHSRWTTYYIHHYRQISALVKVVKALGHTYHVFEIML